jgi:6-phospho-3-hexuloisomerase
MNTIDIGMNIIRELEEAMINIDKESAETFADAIVSAKKIFVAGAGRSLLMVRGLAMRLMHMGYEAYVVGETVTPAIAPEDILIIGSGSGETGTLTVMANKAKKVGAKLALITIYPDSTIGELADYIVKINAATTKSDQISVKSIQPGANMFEQSLLLFCDATIIRIIEKSNIKEENMALMQRHANLE